MPVHSAAQILNRLNIEQLFDALPSGIMVTCRTGSQEIQILKINLKAKEILCLPKEYAATEVEALPAYLDPVKTIICNTSGDILRAEVKIWPPDASEAAILGYNYKKLTPEHVGAQDGLAELPQNDPIPEEQISVLLFTNITAVQKDRLAMEKIKEELAQSKKLASLGTMISCVAHELNNPLAGISMTADLACRMLEAQKSKYLKDVEVDKCEKTGHSQPPIPLLEQILTEMRKISSNTQKAAGLVHDLLNFSKPIKMDLMEEDLCALVDETIHALKTHPDFSQVRFKTSFPMTSMRVLCEKGRLEQVFYNIFKNARDAFMDHAGEIDISIQEDQIVPNSRESIHYTRVQIADNGPGIEKEILSQIFDPFFTTKGTEGVGLGLSISYQTIEQLGGRITVDSEKGKGTIFHILLPVADDENLTLRPALHD